ncbi:MAG: glycoside hydrolase family 2, partial [Candidatus Poribacteria bacterium]|nr:glycoside hydrolase family 2 [Candidatus Poribacteria bacterium]
CLYDHVETDINSWHFYINDYQKAREHIANVVKETYSGSKFNYTGDNEQTNAPMMNSEYGGIGAGAGDKDISWCFKYLTNELRLHQKICGYIYTELQDIEWEHNGFMNYDRTVKEFGYDYTMINALDFIVIDHHPGLSFVPGDLLELDIHSSHFSNKKIEQATLYWRLDGIDRLGSELMDLVSGNVPISFAQYKVEKVHQLSINLPNQPVIGTLHVWVADQNQSVVARNFINVEIFKEPPLIEYPSENTAIMRLDIGDSPVVEFAGSGKLEYTVDLPDSIRLESINCFEIVFEASSYVDGAPQTDWEKHPSDLKITINGIELKTITLPSSPADARGALSYINGIPGKYGFLTKIKVDDEQLNSLRNSLSGNKLTVGYQVDPEAENSGGLTIYGARVGRYPLDPYIIIS